MIDFLKSATGQMLLRKAVTLAAGYFVGTGLFDAKDLNSAAIDAITGGILAAISLAWSSHVKRKHAATVEVLKKDVAAAQQEVAAAKEETAILVNQIPKVKIIPLDQQ